MDREKFDNILRDKVQEFDQKYSPAFNDQKVRNGIKKAGNKNRWFQIASASVIVILGLSIFIQQYVKPVEVVKVKGPGKSGKSIQIPIVKTRNPELFPNKPETQNIQPAKSTLRISKVFKDTSRPVSAVEDKDNILQRADSNQAQTVKTIEPVKIKITEFPLTKNDEIKVTFKRGSSSKTEVLTESKLSLRKFKLRIFENQIYDTSAYASGAEVEAGKKFRFKF